VPASETNAVELFPGSAIVFVWALKMQRLSPCLGSHPADNLKANAGKPAHAKSLLRAMGYVDDAALDEWATVVDANNNAAARPLVYDANCGPKWQAFMRGRYAVHVVALAVCRLAPVELASIPREAMPHSAEAMLGAKAIRAASARARPKIRDNFIGFPAGTKKACDLRAFFG
jgi:hypothetical protein